MVPEGTGPFVTLEGGTLLLLLAVVDADNSPD
jgi:hypothetical protein